MNYFINTVISTTNNKGKKDNARWTDMDLDGRLHFLGLLLAIKVYEIRESNTLYWSNNDNDLRPGMNFEEIITRCRFEEILNCFQFSNAENEDQQILDFLSKVNLISQKSVAPGSFLTLDKNMIKSFHH